MNLKLFQITVVMVVSWQVIHALTGKNVCSVMKSSTSINIKWIPYVYIDTSRNSCNWWQRAWPFHDCWKKTISGEKSTIETRIKWTTVDECCKGYKKTPSDTCTLDCSEHIGVGLTSNPVSVPHSRLCSEDCVNGPCNDSENCICPDGFQKNISEHVSYVSICTESCVNDICSGPGNCTCSGGYMRNTVSPFACIPECSENCGNDICSDPSNCTCPAGFWRDSDTPFNCIPNCNEGCNNNTCMEGYLRVDSDTSRCNYTCSCEAEKCAAPMKCICFNGCDDAMITMKYSEETLPWGFIGAAFLILIMIVCASLLAYYLVKRSKDLVVIEEAVEPSKGPNKMFEENSMYSTLDVLQGTQNMQTAQSSKSQADCLYGNPAFHPNTNVKTDSVHNEENELYEAFEMSALPADAMSK